MTNNLFRKVRKNSRLIGRPAAAHTRQPNTYLKLTVPTTQGSAGFSSEDGSASGGIPAIFGGGKPLLPRNIHAKTCIFTGKLLNIGTVRLTRMGSRRTKRAVCDRKRRFWQNRPTLGIKSPRFAWLNLMYRNFKKVGAGLPVRPSERQKNGGIRQLPDPTLGHSCSALRSLIKCIGNSNRTATDLPAMAVPPACNACGIAAAGR